MGRAALLGATKVNGIFLWNILLGTAFSGMTSRQLTQRVSFAFSEKMMAVRQEMSVVGMVMPKCGVGDTFSAVSAVSCKIKC